MAGMLSQKLQALQAARDQQRLGKWTFCLGIAIVAAVLTFWPHGMQQFRYERTDLLVGGAWRIFTSHLVHLNGMHLLFNLAGLFLLCELLWLDLPLRHGAGLLTASAAGVSALLWWLQPELAWYAGMSGALHGLWAGCALAACWPAQRSPLMTRAADAPGSATSAAHLHWLRWPLPQRVGAAGISLLALKLMSEYYFGVSARTEQAIGGPVIAVAHLYGAMSGVSYVLFWRGMQKLFGKS